MVTAFLCKDLPFFSVVGYVWSGKNRVFKRAVKSKALLERKGDYLRKCDVGNRSDRATGCATFREEGRKRYHLVRLGSLATMPDGNAHED